MSTPSSQPAGPMPERNRESAPPPPVLPIHDIPWSISPAMRAANIAFKRDLPQLLKERRGQWVARDGARTAPAYENVSGSVVTAERLFVPVRLYLSLCSVAPCLKTRNVSSLAVA